MKKETLMATTIYELIPNFQQHLMILGEFAQWFPQMEYHNYDNSMITAARAYIAANECELSEQDQRNLALAALYANTKHVGYINDAKNIENSIEFWNSSLAKIKEHSEEYYCDPNIVENLIRATQQGYHPDPKEANWLLKSLLRDCITLQALNPEWRSHLEKETSTKVSLEDLYNSLITDWGKNYYRENVDALN